MSSSSNHSSNPNSSKPRPIHQLHRELRSQPDEAEPSLSYEQESFLMGREDDVEDEFHRRLQNTRRDSGGSFWRTEFGGPSFSSMSMKQRQDSTASISERRGTSSGRLAVALQMGTSEQNESTVSASNECI